MEGLAAAATATTLAGLSFNGLDGIAATSRGLLLDAQNGFAFVVDYAVSDLEPRPRRQTSPS